VPSGFFFGSGAAVRDRIRARIMLISGVHDRFDRTDNLLRKCLNLRTNQHIRNRRFVRRQMSPQSSKFFLFPLPRRDSWAKFRIKQSDDSHPARMHFKSVRCKEKFRTLSAIARAMFALKRAFI
jgi:hypothetical protein